jgi:DNA mismatch repair protein MutS2
MRFSAGQSVFLRTLNKAGTVMEVLNATTYRVAVGSLSLLCKAPDLAPYTAPEQSKMPRASSAQSIPAAQAPTSLDLHGRTVDEATRALEEWLNNLILSPHSHGKVVHGLGTGKVQRAVHAVLSKYPAVRSFRINDRNPGETDVYL